MGLSAGFCGRHHDKPFRPCAKCAARTQRQTGHCRPLPGVGRGMRLAAAAGMFRLAFAACLSLASSAVLLQGCASGCDQATLDRAVAFLDTHQTCETDADCVVVSDQCGELPGGYCGQLAMNRTGSESAEWKALTKELSDCAADSCSACLAALVPSCTDNVCSKR